MLDRDRSDPVATTRAQIEAWHERTAAELLAEDPEISGYVADGREDLAAALAAARLQVSPRVAAVYEDGWTDATELYPDSTAPTLILKADADAAGRERDRAIAERLPDGRLVHVDGAGHTVVRDEQAAALAELRAFLDGL
jgi:pimeloyl-ACP methyl ester carboxylesterase